MTLDLLTHLLSLTTGLLLALAFVPRRLDRPLRRWLLAVGFAPALAAGVFSITYCACRALDRPAPGVAEPLSAAALVAAFLLVAVRAGGRQPMRTVLEEPRLPWPAAARLAAVMALLPAAVFFVTSSRSGFGGWDAQAWWNYFARALLRGYERIPEALHGTNYPLLLPGWIASQWRISGSESALIPRLCAGSWLVGCVALLLGAGRGDWTAKRGVPAALFVLGAAPVLRSAARQEADLAVAYLLLAEAVALLLSAEETAPASLGALSGCLLGLVAWTKNEGVVWAGAMVLAYGWAAAAGRTRIRIRRTVVLAIVGGSLAPLATLFLYKLFWASEHGQQALASALSVESLARVAAPKRWLAPLGELARTALPSWRAGGWGLSATLLTAAVLWRGLVMLRSGSCAAAGFLLRFAALFVPLLLAFYAATPYPQSWHLRSSFDRLFLQGFPVLALAAVTSTSAGSRSRPGSAGDLATSRED